MSTEYTWVPFFEELGRNLLGYRQDQMKLVAVLNRFKAAGLPLNSAALAIQPFMDPFTFVGTLNRQITIENRQNLCAILKTELNIAANIPSDFDGIPVLNNMRSVFAVPSENLRQKVESLWDLFEALYIDKPLESSEFKAVFDRSSSFKTITRNITFVFFCLRPDVFSALDKNNWSYLGNDPQKIPMALDLEVYKSFLDQCDSQGLSYLKLSSLAQAASSNTAKPDQSISGPLDLNKELSRLQSSIDWSTVSLLTGLAEEELICLHQNLTRKGQIILQGPPGTGKTFVANHIAKTLVGETGFFEKVQFQPSYSYEDFIEGFRPKSVNGQLVFEMKDGIFKTFCQKARETDATCVLLIDEINRANLSNIFGELMYLLEYRDEDIKLQSGELFSIPKNLFIIGTMNTADRSIALIDNALRRRFVFLDLLPNYDLLEEALSATDFNAAVLTDILREINALIGDPGYSIGHSYFLSNADELPRNIQSIWQGEIYPQLKEYFFDQRERIKPFEWVNVERRLSGSLELV